MLNFIIGAIVGGLFGVVMMCLCISAGKADRHFDKIER